ncbi:methyl-accepting chemotaxis protein [Paraburkholderia sp. EG287A]|uniref:methyl-accepting chemotaxis protein n=1 Tax=Paraburkholderia sp. EG287A TaxID=3237012 RepID=UPI0034D3102A
MKVKLWLALGVVWAGLGSLGAYATYDAHSRLVQERLAALDIVLDTAANIAESYQAKVSKGEMSEQDARKAVLAQWDLLHYGKTGYVYAATLQNISLLNPGRPELVGKDATSMTDARGRHPYVDLSSLARAKGHGYISAWSKKPGTQDVTEKISAVRVIPQWDWFVAAGLYSDDIESAFTGILVAHLLFVLAAGIVSTLVMVFIIRNIQKSLGGEPAYAMEVANRIADGDLSLEVAVKAGDQQSMLFAMARMRNSLADVIRCILESAESVSTGASQIAAGNSDLSGRTEMAAAALEQTTSSMAELTTAVDQTASNAQDANRLASEASSYALEGHKAVDQVVTAMASIEEASGQIGEIVATIDSIAFQTNILSLNAAVEAARAGEQGRGFAVVASEVRALAQRSATAAKEIKALIDSSVQRVKAGAVHVTQAGKTMTDIVSGVNRVTDIMTAIATASSEQSNGIAQVHRAIAQMDEATEQNASLVEEASAAAHALNEQAQSLRSTMAAFRVA